MTCEVSDTSRSVTWFKNGKIISKTPKTAHFSGKLYIYCLESSDSGVYMCKGKVNLTEICTYSLIVKNQGMLWDITVQLVVWKTDLKNYNCDCACTGNFKLMKVKVIFRKFECR